MKFIYIGRISCFMADAASIRVHNVAAALKQQGHQVDFICQEGIVPNGTYINEGSTCYGVFGEKTGKLSMWLEWLLGNGAVRQLKALLKNTRYDGVILYNAPITTGKRVYKLCRRLGMAVFGDITEWYDIHRANGPLAAVFAWLVDRRIRLLDRKCDGMIAISPYLEAYYAGKVPVFNLPPVFEENGRPNTWENDPYKFLYAGSPSKKDELYNFIEAVKRINSEDIRVEMTIIGAPIPTDSQQLLEKGIRYLPRMPHEAVLDALGQHDFSVLLRSNARYAKAGYSTKVAESLYNGTPVFCNEIGGADMDIRHGCNGIKISAADTQTIENALTDILQMSRETILEMKNQAFVFGQKKYARKNYDEDISKFISELVKA